jgi:hypothetical protein
MPVLMLYPPAAAAAAAPGPSLARSVLAVTASGQDTNWQRFQPTGSMWWILSCAVMSVVYGKEGGG